MQAIDYCTTIIYVNVDVTFYVPGMHLDLTSALLRRCRWQRTESAEKHVSVWWLHSQIVLPQRDADAASATSGTVIVAWSMFRTPPCCLFCHLTQLVVH